MSPSWLFFSAAGVLLGRWLARMEESKRPPATIETHAGSRPLPGTEQNGAPFSEKRNAARASLLRGEVAELEAERFKLQQQIRQDKALSAVVYLLHSRRNAAREAESAERAGFGDWEEFSRELKEMDRSSPWMKGLEEWLSQFKS